MGADNSKSFLKRFFIFLLFALPFAYIGIMFAVTIHEISGHGLGSLVLGGTFDGFTLKPDGMGWANVDTSNISITKQALVYLIGPASTLVWGIILLIFAYALRKRFFTSLGVLILALNCLLEGPPYIFWNAIKPLPPGDIGRILELIPSASLRFTLMIIGGIITLGGIVLVNILLYNKGYSYLSKAKDTTTLKKWIFILVLFAAQAGSWFIFDWNQLAPGLDMLPNIVGTAITGIVLLVLGLKKETKNNEEINDSSWKLAIGTAWIVVIIIAILTITLFQYSIVLK